MKRKTLEKIIYYQNKNNIKPLIVFISGAACDQTLWGFQRRYYSNKDYSTFIINLPGHGSNNEKALKSIEKMGEYITENLKKLSHKKFILISHSMGTLISLYIASKKVLDIEKMVLIGTAFPMKVSAFLLDLSKNDQSLAINNMIKWSIPERKELYGSQLIGMRLHNFLYRVMEKTKKGVLLQDLMACNKFNLSNQLLKNIDIPTCIISGDKDIMTSVTSADYLNGILSNSEMKVIYDCGHFHMFEHPNNLRNIISKFIGV